MKIFSRLAFGALAVAIVAGSAGTLQAACPGAPGLNTTGALTDGQSYLSFEGWPTPGTSCFTFGCYQDPLPNLAGDFWALGDGGPNNNGAFPVTDWVNKNGLVTFGYFYLPGGFMSTNWNASGAINGCVFDPTVGPNGECTCVLLTAERDGVGYASLFEGRIDGIGNTDLSQAGDAPLVLRPIPPPRMVSSVRNPTTFNIDSLVVTVPDATGVYRRDGCNCDVTSKYLVRGQVLPRTAPAPTDRDIVEWQPLTLAGGGTQPLNDTGSQVDLESMCGAADTNLWLVADLTYDSGFTTRVVSSNATKIECGPNLAGPINRRPTRVDRPANQRRGRVERDEGGR